MTEPDDTSALSTISEEEVEHLRRTYFPGLLRDAVFLNVAGGSPMCRPSALAACSVIEEMSEAGDRHFLRYIARAEQGRARIAQYLQADAAEDIAFTANSSSSSAAAVRMLSRTGVRRLFSPKWEFPTSTQAALALGLETIFLDDGFSSGRRPIGSALDAAREISGKDFDGSAVILSHVNYLTGCRTDLAEAAEACRERGMMLCVNATQSFGALPICVSKGGPELLFGSGLKWAHAGFGTGFLYIRRSLVERFGLPELTSWLSVRDPGRMDCTSHEPNPWAKSLDMGGGAPPFQTILALCGALDMISEIGGGNIRKGVSRIERRMIDGALRFRRNLASSGCTFLIPNDEAQRSGIVSIAHPRAPDMVKALEQRQIFCTLRRNPDDGTSSIVRFGVPFFATIDEIDRAAETAGEWVTKLRR